MLEMELATPKGYVLCKIQFLCAYKEINISKPL